MLNLVGRITVRFPATIYDLKGAGTHLMSELTAELDSTGGETKNKNKINATIKMIFLKVHNSILV
jgi:hypothetical protein